jgi:hypothetical protein
MVYKSKVFFPQKKHIDASLPINKKKLEILINIELFGFAKIPSNIYKNLLFLTALKQNHHNKLRIDGMAK